MYRLYEIEEAVCFGEADRWLGLREVLSFMPRMGTELEVTLTRDIYRELVRLTKLIGWLYQHEVEWCYWVEEKWSSNGRVAQRRYYLACENTAHAVLFRLYWSWEISDASAQA